MKAEKLLPQNIEAECGVLGSIIIDPEALALVADFLHAEDFYRDAHRTIYDAASHLYERREPPDFLMLCDELERRHKLEDVGGASYITSLVNQVPTSGNVEHYGRIVERNAILRRLIHGAGQIAAAAYEEADDALEQAESLIYGISSAKRQPREAVSVGNVFSEMFDELVADSAPGGSIVGVPTGLDALDAETSGLHRTDLTVLAGRPATGKTSLALTIARNASVLYGRNVLFFSLEMSRSQLVQRLAAFEAGVNLKRLWMKQLSEEEKERVIAASGRILDAPLYIDDTPGITPMQMRSKIRRAMTTYDVDLIVVDYLQKMKATYQDGKRYHDRYQEVSEVARELKNIAREFDVPVLALAQLSRKVEERANKIPQMSDLRESGDIEQEADVITLMYRDDYYAGYHPDGSSKSDRPGTVDLIIAKHRKGPVGEVRVGFDVTQTRFYNLEQPPEQAKPLRLYTMESEERDDD